MPRLAITERVSLEGFADGWGADCYVTVLPLTYDEFKSFQDMKGKVEEADSGTVVDTMIDLVEKHIISGKVMAFDDNNQTILTDLDPQDIRQSVGLASHLFAEIAGVVDPKVSSTTTVNQPTSDSSTSPSSDTNS